MTTTPQYPAKTLSQGARWSFFAVVSSGLLMVGLDNSILYTALPALNEQLNTSSTQQLWIINAYALVLAGLLLGTGTLGDKLGHRRMFVLGLWIFGAASLAAAFAPTAWALVAARAVLGLGAAIMMPATLALIRLTFHDEIERNTAIGIWSSVAVVGAAAGPTVGGFLLEHFWWGSVFLINVPIVALALVATALLAPPNIANPDKHWDLFSSLLALVSLSSLVMAIKSAASTEPHWGLVTAALIVCALGAFFFARRQHHLIEPLLTFSIFRSSIFSGGVLTAGGAMFTLAGVEMTTTQKLQLVDGFSPLHAGLIISAMAIAAVPTSTLGGASLHRVGFLPLISGGFLLMAAGVGAAFWAGRHDMFWLFVLAMVFTGMGAGLAMSVASTAIIGAAPPHRSGMAASVEEVSYEFGTLLSIAITGSLVPLFMAQGLPHQIADLGLEALYQDSTHAAAAMAYNDGYMSMLCILAAVTVGFAAITAFCFRRNPKSGGYVGSH